MFGINAARKMASATSAIFVYGILLLAEGTSADSQDNYLSDRYSINQAFGGRAYRKDNNIWVVSPEFAKTFGMPDSFIDAKLKGIEAAAFRIEKENYQMCGFGGKNENCAVQERCLLDIYIDESKYPLPWASVDRAGWLSAYNSLFFLRTPADKGFLPRYPENVVPNTGVKDMFTLHPFSDPESKIEANYFTNAYVAPDHPFQFSNAVPIFGFYKNAIAGLSMVSLGLRCYSLNPNQRSISFLLDERKKILGNTIKNFHEYSLPESFVYKIDLLSKEFKANNSKNLGEFIKQ